MTTQEALAAEFKGGEVLQFQGRGGMTFDYIEDETVMDRLDEALGVGAWSITVEPISLADGICKVRLSGFMPDGHEFTYEDFGYATRTDGEALKEAVSDGIRRCGRFLGVGRYLYKKHVTTPQNGSGRPQPQRAPLRAVTAQREFNGVPATDPGGPDDPFGEFAPIPTDRAIAGPNECAIHGEAWRGTPGDLYHKKAEGGYCRHPENVVKPARAR